MRFTLDLPSLHKRAETTQKKGYESLIQKAETLFETGKTYYVRLFLPPSAITKMLLLGETWPCVPIKQAFINMGEKKYATWHSDEIIRGGVDTFLDWAKSTLYREQGYYDLKPPTARIERMRKAVGGDKPEFTILSDKAIEGLVNKHGKGMAIKDAERAAKAVRLPSQLYKDKFFVPMLIMSEDLNEETGQSEAVSKLILVEFKNSRFVKALGTFTHWVGGEERHIVEGSLFDTLRKGSETPASRKKSGLPEDSHFMLFSTMTEALKGESMAYDIVLTTKTAVVGTNTVQDYDLDVRREAGKPKITDIPEETIEQVISSHDDVYEAIMRGFGTQTESGAFTRPLQGIEAMKVVLGDIPYQEYAAKYNQSTANSDLPENLPGEEETIDAKTEEKAPETAESSDALIEKLLEDALKYGVEVPETLTSTSDQAYGVLRRILDIKIKKAGTVETLPFDAPM